MAQKQRTTVDILKALNKSNCKECGCPTCLAFAALVVQGKKKLRECPHLSEEAIAALGGDTVKKEGKGEDTRDERFERLAGEFARVDFEEAARRIGGTVNGERLEVICLGRGLELDGRGKLASGSHVDAAAFAGRVVPLARSAAQGHRRDG